VVPVAIQMVVFIVAISVVLAYFVLFDVVVGGVVGVDMSGCVVVLVDRMTQKMN